MRLSILAASLTASLLLAAGCDNPAIHNSLNRSAASAALGVGGSLPDTIAGPRQNLKLHSTIDSIPLQYAEKHGNEVELFSRGIWNGKRVDLYFLPASNLIEHGHEYELRSTKGVQKIASATVRKDGTWRTTWHVGGYHIPPHLPFFILAKDTNGEYGLIQISTKD